MRKILLRVFGAILAVTIVMSVYFLLIPQVINGMSEEMLDRQQARTNQQKTISQSEQAQLHQQAIINAAAQDKVQEIERAFYKSYKAPANCASWQSNKHMVECTNHRMRAKTAFREAFSK